MISKQQMIQHN